MRISEEVQVYFLVLLHVFGLDLGLAGIVVSCFTWPFCSFRRIRKALDLDKKVLCIIH